MRLLRTAKHLLSPYPSGRHVIPSYAISADDDGGRPTSELLDLALAAIDQARRADLAEIAARDPDIGRFISVWPGEHYRLLSGLVMARRPSLVVEIGTATGASALCLKLHLPAGGRLVTFDIVPWRSYKGSILRDGEVEQIVTDLSLNEAFAVHRGLLESAELLFIDGPKDGRTEYRLWRMLDGLKFKPGAVAVFDDIRFPNMIPLWRSIVHPKLDMTSFGHWSGTGLVSLPTF
jgi:predicted O-methyltransferase YrrM